MGSGTRSPWRSSCLALLVLPVVLPLLLLCLPPLCFAVAAVRFRRGRRRAGSRCLGGGGGGEREAGAGAALLHKYLEDQMRLVGAAVDRRPGC